MRKVARSRCKLPFFTALYPYLGGKRRLCPVIFREIDRVLPRREWQGKTFLDGFLGGGSVSLYAKAMGFRVVAVDIAERAITVGRALVENSRVKLTREDVIRVLTPNPEPAMRVEREMVPAIFTANVARLIDRALSQAHATTDPAKAALLRMLAIRVALLEHPMSQVRKGTIHRVATGEFESITESCVHHYVGGLRLTRMDRVWALAQQINGGVFQGEGVVHQGSVMDLLSTIEADVAYFDPPYPGVMSYEKEYKVIDEILEGTSRPTSPFTARDGAAVIDGLFERAWHIPIWLLSLGNAVVTLDELVEKMRRLGRETKAIEIKYTHLPSIATAEKNKENREFLVVGWDPAAPTLRGLHRVTASVATAEQTGDLTVALDEDQHIAREFIYSAAGLAGDPRHQLQPRLGFDVLSASRERVGEVLDDTVNSPLRLTDEPRVHGNGEVRTAAFIRHGGTVQPDRSDRHGIEE